MNAQVKEPDTQIVIEIPELVVGRPLSEKEQHWADFVRDLQPWEARKLHRVGELELHDSYVHGDEKLVDIFVQICIAGDEESYSKKVKEEA